MHMLRFLGEVSVGVPAGAANRQLSRPLSVSILAYLAASERGGVTRDRLVALLWEGADRNHARHSLSNQLHILRKGLGPDGILTSGEFVRLNEEVVSADVAEFKRALRDGDLERAASLYSGPLLDGFHLDGSDEFQRWVDDERSVLAAQALEVFESLAARAIAAGDLEEALRWLQPAAQHDPYNSRAAVALAHAMAASRDPGNGVQVLQRHVERLRDDLGIEPDSEILDLIRTGDFGLSEAVKSIRAPNVTGADQRPVSPIEAIPGVSRKPNVVRRIAATAAVLVLITATAALVNRVRGGDQFDPGLVAVLPVRPVGVDSLVSDRVTEQFYSALADWEMPRAGRRDETDALWRRLGGSLDGDQAADIGQRVGARIGAGAALTATASRARDGIEVSASLVGVPDGELLAAASASGPVDSLAEVVHSLLVGLIAEGQGIPADRIASLELQDPVAARLFLQAHPHDSDTRDRLLREALARDSTFALAALELHASLGDYHGLHLNDPWEDVAFVAWEHRHRLSPADRAWAEALLGWRYQDDYSASIHVDAWQRAVEIAPDRLEHWQGLFLECYRWCSEVQRGWREGLLEVHDSLIEREDQSFLEQAMEVAFAENDTLRLLSYADLLPADAWYGRWLAAVGLGREKERSRLRERLPEMGNFSLMRIGNATIMTGRGLEDAEQAAVIPDRDRTGSIYSLRQMVLARERGRHAEYRRLRDKLFQYFDVRDAVDALAAANVIFEWGYFGEPESEATLDAMDQMLSEIVSASLVVSPDSLAVAQCYRAQLRLLRQDTVGVAAAVDYLTNSPVARSMALPRICAPFLQFLDARDRGRNHHAEAARRLFDVMEDRPMSLGRGAGMFVVETNLAASVNLELARSLGELGYPESGLQVAERRPYQASLWGLYGFHVDFVREEARLLAQAGEVEAALERYERFFRLRPEPPDLESWAEDWQAVRIEYAVLKESTDG